MMKSVARHTVDRGANKCVFLVAKTEHGAHCPPGNPDPSIKSVLSPHLGNSLTHKDTSDVSRQQCLNYHILTVCFFTLSPLAYFNRSSQ